MDENAMRMDATRFRAAVFGVCVKKNHMAGCWCFESPHFEEQLFAS